MTWIRSPSRKLKFGISILRHEDFNDGEYIHNGLDNGETCGEERPGEQCDDVGQGTEDELSTGSDTEENRALVESNSPKRWQPAC